MKRIFMMVLLLGAIGLLQPPRSAYACSFSPDYSAVAASTLIVGGRVTGWEALEGSDAGYPFVRFAIQVDQLFKGEGPPPATFQDMGSLYTDGEVYEWQGNSGNCSLFEEDPTGRYVVVGLAEDTVNGGYQTAFLALFFIGEAPDGEQYGHTLDALAPLRPTPIVVAEQAPATPTLSAPTRVAVTEQAPPTTPEGAAALPLPTPAFPMLPAAPAATEQRTSPWLIGAGLLVLVAGSYRIGWWWVGQREKKP